MRTCALVAAVSLLAACSADTGACDPKACSSTCRDGCEADDSKPPGIFLTSPVDGAFLTGETLEIAGSVGDLSTFTLEVSVDGEVVESSMPTAGLFQASADVSWRNGVPVALAVKATDVHGNVSQVHARVLVDNVAPVLSLSSPAEGATLLAADPNVLAVEGTVIDGTLETLELSMDGGAPVTVEFEGQTFRRVLPLDPTNLVSRRILVRAVDRAGHESTVEREFRVDTFAPQVTALPVDGRRNVGCPVTLVEFSEAMDEAWVLAATTIDGQPLGPSAHLVQERLLVLSDCSGLPADKPLTLIVSTNARDLAGNPITEPVDAFFHRRAAALPLAQGLIEGSRPSLAVDSDGIPFIGYWDPVAPGFMLMWWDGAGSFKSMPLFESAELVTPCTRPIHLVVRSRLMPDGLSLERNLELAACGRKLGASTAEIHYFKATLDRLGGELDSNYLQMDASASIRGNPRVNHEQRADGSTTTRISYARENVSGAVEIWERTFVGNSVSLPTAVATGLGEVTAVGGDAVLAGSNLYYVPASGTPAFTGTAISSAFGSRALWAEMPSGDTTYWGRDKSAFLIWSTTNAPGLLHIACARGDSTYPLWRERVEALGEIRSVQLEIGARYAAIAIDNSSDAVLTGRVVNDYCEQQPRSVSWNLVRSNAREPWSLFGEDGKQWLAYVDTATGKIALDRFW